MPDAPFGSIFDYPGINAKEFIAAAWKLDQVQKNDIRTVDQEEVDERIDADQNTKFFLDAIAYFFAKSKVSNDEANHVTTTALCRGTRRRAEEYTLYVTKNRGADRWDRMFCDDLQDWMNGIFTVKDRTVDELREEHYTVRETELAPEDNVQQTDDDDVGKGLEIDKNLEDEEDLPDLPDSSDRHDPYPDLNEEDREMWSRICDQCFKRQILHFRHS